MTTNRKPKQTNNYESQRKKDWLDQANRLQSHFGRYFWEFIGVSAFAVALLFSIGLLNISHGAIISEITAFSLKWLGWGNIFLVIGLIAIGLESFKKAHNKPSSTIWERVLLLLVAALLILAMLSITRGSDLAISEVGWGGRVGWGLSIFFEKAFGPFGGLLAIIIILLLTFFLSFGGWQKFERYLFKKIGENIKSPVMPSIKIDVPAPERDVKVKYKNIKNINDKLPIEFRKSFKFQEKQEPKIAPLIRGEKLPPLAILSDEQTIRPDNRSINLTAGLIEKTLSEFGIPAKVTGFRIGPTVTQFAVQPGFIKKGDADDAQQLKVRVAQIAGLQKDIALALSAERLRIEAPVPGKDFVGIEVPNQRAMTVRLRPILEADVMMKLNSPLAIALGRDVSGQPIAADLGRMPHLLIAGTTGSGKSVCIAMIATCLAMNNSPEDLRLVMIDSKMVELIRFNGLPHLFGKVETDIQRIMGVLRWVVVEMEHRYKLLEAAKARDIDAYNQRLSRRKDFLRLPRIVVLIDELADLMMSAPDQTEHNLVRLAQMARATGIHLIVATQRPSTDVVTGLIKANFPARLAFAVASGIDSRVILDLPGAETLLGKGDMLFLNPEVGNPTRAQGAIVTDQEIERVISYWQNNSPEHEQSAPWESILSETDNKDGDDVLVERAIMILKKERRVSASMLQRRLNIGFPRAARLLDQIEKMGVVGPAMGGGRDREVLLNEDESDEDE